MTCLWIAVLAGFLSAVIAFAAAAILCAAKERGR